jgi:hypothetical protein
MRVLLAVVIATALVTLAGCQKEIQEIRNSDAPSPVLAQR